MRVHCPKHKDQNPSCEVYEDSAWCFSGCGRVPLGELGLEGIKQEPRPIEDVEEALRRIGSLPVDVFRGFPLPYDSRGYYLVWDNAPYYKQRMFSPGKGPKYVGPSGHKPPLFWARNQGLGTLFVIEGEFEALSAALAVVDWDVLSPGSASQFSSQILIKTCLRYYEVVVCTDSDPAGVKAAKDLASNLVYKVPILKVFYKDKERDFNKILTTDGQEALREEIGKGLRGGVSWQNT